MRLLRPRFTILTLMVVVVISAIVMSWFRPISRAEAEKIAEARFLKIPGSSRWIGRYRVHAYPGDRSDTRTAGPSMCRTRGTDFPSLNIS